MIAADVLSAVEQGRNPVIITERTDHLDRLSGLLAPHVQHFVALQGGMGAKQRREIDSRLKQIPANEPRVLIATGKFLGEGYDDARLDTLFLCLPISWKGTVAQYAGRLHRLNDKKKEVIIYDYLDDKVPIVNPPKNVQVYEGRTTSYTAKYKEYRYFFELSY